MRKTSLCCFDYFKIQGVKKKNICMVLIRHILLFLFLAIKAIITSFSYIRDFFFQKFWCTIWENRSIFIHSSSWLHTSRHAGNISVWGSFWGTSVFYRKSTSMFWNGKWSSTDSSPYSYGNSMWHCSTGEYTPWIEGDQTCCMDTALILKQATLNMV